VLTLQGIKGDKMNKKEQFRLEVAEMRAREAQERIDALFGDKPTNTFMTQWSPEVKDLPLLPSANIKFQIGKHGESIQVRIRNDSVLEIMGDTAIIICPRAANTLEIKIRD